MVKTLDQEIIEAYDGILSGLDHISSLNINVDNVKKSLEFSSVKGDDCSKTITSAHERFIGDIVFSSSNANIIDAKRYISYPDFSVRTYMPNKEYFHQDSQSLEKAVIIGSRSELSLIINDPRFRSESKLDQLVLNIERIAFSYGIDYYKLTFRSVPSSLFYDYYVRIISPYKRYRQITDNDYIHFKSMAVRDCLNMLNSESVTLEGEFTLKREDYPKLKSYLKSRYGIDYQDSFKSVTGEETDIWIDLGVVRFDNRALMKDSDGERPYPLEYQRVNQLSNNKKTRL